jgi:hypothetical protein
MIKKSIQKLTETVDLINLDIKWKNIFIYIFLGCILLNAIMFLALFGLVAVLVLIIIVLCLVIFVQYVYNVRFTKIILSMEDALSDSMERVNISIEEFSRLMKEIPYIDDHSATIKMRNVLIDIKMNIAAVPKNVLYSIKNNTIEEDIEIDEDEYDNKLGDINIPIYGGFAKEETEEEYLEKIRKQIENMQ